MSSVLSFDNLEIIKINIKHNQGKRYWVQIKDKFFFIEIKKIYKFS